MPPDFTTLSLAETLVEAEAISRDVQTAFGQLNAEQLNWKANTGLWSVAQCLEHLIAANRGMFGPLDEIISGQKRATLWERMPVVPGLLGKLMVKSVSPNATQKLKAPASIQPASSAIDAQIVNRFIEHQRELIGRLTSLENFFVERIVMTSPFLKVMTYSVLDACRLIVAHERRHMAQAQRVMETPGFPK
jgi:hypothetical protein